MKNSSHQRFASETTWTRRPHLWGLALWLGLSLLICGVPAEAQSQQSPGDTAAAGVPGGEQTPDQQVAGTISGTVVDQSGAIVAGASVRLVRRNPPASQEALSGPDGQFTFSGIAPGPFQLTITSAGFAMGSSSGILRPGEIHVLPQIVLVVAAAVTEFRVMPPEIEVAQAQVKEQEKQRVLGVIPNFYVSYIPDAAPLSSKQKFELAWRTTLDPVTFGVTAAVAGLEQAQNVFSGYGPGAKGYAKRYGASYADLVTGTFIGSAILPSLLKQDPRYFYKGSGSTRSRVLYAIANAVICKGDNKRWQANYSSILGGVAAGGVSNLYYPAQSRSVALTFENAVIGLGESAAANLFQEFVIRKLTPNTSSREPDKS